MELVLLFIIGFLTVFFLLLVYILHAGDFAEYNEEEDLHVTEYPLVYRDLFPRRYNRYGVDRQHDKVFTSFESPPEYYCYEV